MTYNPFDEVTPKDNYNPFEDTGNQNNNGDSYYEAIKDGLVGGLTPDQQNDVNSLREEIRVNNAELEKYDTALGDSLDMPRKSPESKKAPQIHDIKKADYNPLYNKLRVLGYDDKRAREYLSTNYNITD